VDICFVTLVDTRDRQRLVLMKKRGMILGKDEFFDLTQKVGVLCDGPGNVLPTPRLSPTACTPWGAWSTGNDLD
jgi:hypothetical protein